MNQQNPKARKTTAAKKTAAPPPPSTEIDPPTEDPEAVVDVTPDPIPVEPNHVIMDFRRSAPEYDMDIIDKLIARGRGDLVPFRNAIVDAVDEGDERSDLVGQFKAHFETTNKLDMPLLNEAVNNGHVTARDLRGRLWKTIKSLPVN